MVNLVQILHGDGQHNGLAALMLVGTSGNIWKGVNIGFRRILKGNALGFSRGKCSKSANNFILFM